MSITETPGKVLVVEDEVEIRRFIRLSLQAESLEVSEADSVQRGLIEAGTRRPDLVVLDLGLPDGDGIDFIRGQTRPEGGARFAFTLPRGEPPRIEEPADDADNAGMEVAE